MTKNEETILNNLVKTLLQAAEMQKMTNHTDRLFSEIMRQQRSHLNKQVYELAERQGVSIYDICLQYMPQMSEPQFSHTDDGTVTYEQDIRLVPMPFEPDKGPDYWKDKYCRLKELHELNELNKRNYGREKTLRSR